MRRLEKGQVLVLFAFGLIVAIALVSFAVDGAIYVAHWQQLQVDLDAACVAAGAHGVTDPVGGFHASLIANGVPAEYYTPFELDANGNPIRGIIGAANNTWMTALKGPHDFYLAQMMGVRSMNVAVRSRCTLAMAGTPPILVREDWVIQSRDTGTDFPIFGHGAEAIEAQGSDFRGAALPHMWCEDFDGNVSDQCEDPRWFNPVDPATGINQYKFIVEDLIKRDVGAPWVPPGTRVGHVAGVSTNPTVHAMEDAGYVPGDHIIVMVFDGIIIRPDSNPRENAAILYYVEAEITLFDPNTMYAKFVGPALYTQADVAQLTTSRVVPWTWAGLIN